MNALLWVIQTLLALLFLLAGGAKLAMPAQQLTAHTPLPAAFLRFIGAVEVLGALGLLLPGMLRVRTLLTPLAALGLFIIMVAAVVISARTMGPATAVLPLVAGVLAVFVAWARWRVSPMRTGKHQLSPHAASNI